MTHTHPADRATFLRSENPGRADGLPKRRAPAAFARVRLLCSTLALLAAALPAAAENEVELLGSDPGLVHLAAEIERISESSLGRVGVAAIHLESGRGVLLNSDESFPMASTYKVPIAVEILAGIDEGKRSLDDLVTMADGDHFLTHGALSDWFAAPGSRITIRNLLEMMLRNSDNIATDLLFREAGGGAAVTARMRAAGIDDLRVDRTTRALIANWLGRPDATVESPIPAAEYNALIVEFAAAQPTPSQRAALDRAFLDDPRDHSTPRAMAALLSKIWKREILSAESSAVLIDIMARCQTGLKRLPGMLPPGTPIAHKTGTIGQATNNVGVITLPGDAGHVVAAVYVKDSRLPSTEAMEPVIAQTARAAYDYFLFHPGRD